MTEDKKLKLLEEMLELDEGALSPDMALKDIPEWDSMALLSFVVLMDENFHKKADISAIRDFKTVREALSYMEEAR